MRSALQIFLYWSVCASFFFSCTKTPQYIETVRLTEDLYIETTDTITPQYTVFRLDSFVTSGSNQAIIGGVTDPYFGRITSETFARLKLAAGSYGTVGAENEYYDSLVMILHTDSTYYGDTLSWWRVSVHRLKQEIDVSRTYYNHNLVPYFEEELGRTAVRFRPQVDDSVRVRLADEWGREIFNLYRNNDARIQTQEEFQRYFAGIGITGSVSNEVVLRFPVSDSTLVMRLYYHEDRGTGVSKHLDFPVEGNNAQFNHISCDVSSSELRELVPGAEFPSEQLDHLIFLNDLAGIGTRIRFPSAQSLSALPNFLRLADGLLYLRPVSNSFAGFPLIPSLGLSLFNESGISNTPLYSADNSYIQDGNLQIDLLMGEQTGYTYDVAALMRSEIIATPATSFSAYLRAGGVQSSSFSMQRLVAADNRRTVQPSTLQTRLIFYKK